MMRWSDKPVYLCFSCTDVRKSINGLMTLVQESFTLGPFADALFVFSDLGLSDEEFRVEISNARDEWLSRKKPDII